MIYFDLARVILGILSCNANAFNNSRAYYQAEPLSVNLAGVREWQVMYMFIMIVRIPGILDYYRSKGLGFFKYIYTKIENFPEY